MSDNLTSGIHLVTYMKYRCSLHSRRFSHTQNMRLRPWFSPVPRWELMLVGCDLLTNREKNKLYNRGTQRGLMF